MTKVKKTNADICLELYLKSKPFIKNFRTGIDIGCRDGDFARPMSEDFKYVHCFDYRERMKFEKSNVYYYKCALGDEETQVKSFGGVIVEKRGDSNPVIVQQKLLDSYNFKEVDYIKIDVEGHELKVLKGAVNTIKQFYPIMVVEENGSAEVWNKGVKNEALNFLKEMGYEIVAQTKTDYILEKK